PFLLPHQTRGDSQQRRLAGPVRPYQADDLSGCCGERHVPQRPTTAVPLGHIDQGAPRTHSTSSSARPYLAMNSTPPATATAAASSTNATTTADGVAGSPTIKGGNTRTAPRACQIPTQVSLAIA